MSRRYRDEAEDGFCKKIIYLTPDSKPPHFGVNEKRCFHRKHNMPALIENCGDDVFNDRYITWNVKNKIHNITNGDAYFPSIIFYSKDNRCQTQIEFHEKGVLKCRRIMQENDYHPSVIGGNGDATWIEIPKMIYTGSPSVVNLFDRNSNKRKYQHPSHISEDQIIYPNREWGLKK